MEIGSDIVSVERIKNAINTPGFKERVFTPNEIEYCEKRKNKFENYAGRYAAKEAFVKALGTGFRNISLLDIEVVNDDLGKPSIRYLGESTKVSISHEREYAVAFVLLER